MNSSTLKRAFTLGCLLCLALPVACGDDDDDAPGTAGKGGSAGSSGTSGSGGGGRGNTAGSPSDAGAGMELPPGLSDEPSTEECGAETCESAQAAGVYYVDPCCGAGDACGLNTGFLSLVGAQFTETCQLHDQPGTDEGFCAAATGLKVPFQGREVDIDPFPGCCRPDGTCGVVVNDVTVGGVLPLAKLGLGCVEAAPFFNGVSKRCDDDSGAGGGGGTGSGEGGGGAVPSSMAGNGGANP